MFMKYVCQDTAISNVDEYVLLPSIFENKVQKLDARGKF